MSKVASLARSLSACSAPLCSSGDREEEEEEVEHRERKREDREGEHSLLLLLLFHFVTPSLHPESVRRPGQFELEPG